MERICNGFKRNMQGAYKTVKSNFKEYICFFFALIMVEALFGVLFIAYFNNRTVERNAIVSAGYDCHGTLTGAVSDDEEILKKAFTEARDNGDLYFNYRNDNGQLKITFKGNVENNYRRFSENVLILMNISAVYPRVSISLTPLYTLDTSLDNSLPTLFLLLGLFGLLSFFLLMALFRIKINHFKFTYSIYMAFGGNFKKLMGSAFYEILFVSLVSFFPAVILSYGIGALIYLPFGQPFGFYILSLPIMPVCALICSSLALLLPIRVLASSTPIKQMRAADNSNLIRSPRKSALMLKKSPVYIEKKALWRFRPHIVILLFSTVSFAVLFVLGCYIADVYKVRSSVPTPELTVTFPQSADAAHFKEYFDAEAKKQGLGGYIFEKSETASDSSSTDVTAPPHHIALPKERVSSSAFSECLGNPGFSATEQLTIRPFDRDAYDCFRSVYNYEYEGDPELLLSDPSSLILSDSLANSKALSVKPGDKVYLSVSGTLVRSEGYDPSLSSLDIRMEHYLYQYKEFTVAAVITNYSDYTGMLVYLPSLAEEGEKSGYAAVLGEEPDYNRINIYLEDKTKETAAGSIVKLYSQIFDESITYQKNAGSIRDAVQKGQNTYSLILIMSAMIFAVSPVAGFFSQILFYKKRHPEYDVLRATGAVTSDIRKMFLFDGAVMTVLSGGMFAGLSYGAIHLMTALLNTPFVFGIIDSVSKASKFYPQMPRLPFILGLILTMLFSFLEVMISMKIYLGNQSENFAEKLSADDNI